MWCDCNVILDHRRVFELGKRRVVAHNLRKAIGEFNYLDSLKTERRERRLLVATHSVSEVNCTAVPSRTPRKLMS